jgi:hypothetical protein
VLFHVWGWAGLMVALTSVVGTVLRPEVGIGTSAYVTMGLTFWIGGMVLLGLSAMLCRQSYVARYSGPPSGNPSTPKRSRASHIGATQMAALPSSQRVAPKPINPGKNFRMRYTRRHSDAATTGTYAAWRIGYEATREARWRRSQIRRLADQEATDDNYKAI